MTELLSEFRMSDLESSLCKHVHRICNYFNHGILVSIFDELLFKFCNFKLSNIVKDTHKFLTQKCKLQCSNMNQNLIYYLNPTVNIFHILFIQ